MMHRAAAPLCLRFGLDPPERRVRDPSPESADGQVQPSA